MNSASEVGWAEGTASRSQKKGHQLQDTFPHHFQDPARTLMICVLLVLQLDSTLESQEAFGKTLMPGFHLQPLWFNSSRVCLDWEYLSFPNDSDVLSGLGAVVCTTYAAAGRKCSWCCTLKGRTGAKKQPSLNVFHMKRPILGNAYALSFNTESNTVRWALFISFI